MCVCVYSLNLDTCRQPPISFLTMRNEKIYIYIDKVIVIHTFTLSIPFILPPMRSLSLSLTCRIFVSSIYFPRKIAANAGNYYCLQERKPNLSSLMGLHGDGDYTAYRIWNIIIMKSSFITYTNRASSSSRIRVADAIINVLRMNVTKDYRGIKYTEIILPFLAVSQ